MSKNLQFTEVVGTSGIIQSNGVLSALLANPNQVDPEAQVNT